MALNSAPCEFMPGPGEGLRTQEHDFPVVNLQH